MELEIMVIEKSNCEGKLFYELIIKGKTHSYSVLSTPHQTLLWHALTDLKATLETENVGYYVEKLVLSPCDNIFGA